MSLYQLRNTGSILFGGAPYQWQELDNNPLTIAITACGGNLYQLHRTGSIWTYTGTPFTGWQEIDDNPAAIQIVSNSDSSLYQLRNDGSILLWTGLSQRQELDNNPATIAIAANG